MSPTKPRSTSGFSAAIAIPTRSIVPAIHARPKATTAMTHRPTRLPAAATMADIPAKTPFSDALTNDLRRRGFGFVGSPIVYAFRQSVGLVDAPLPGCFRYRG